MDHFSLREIITELPSSWILDRFPLKRFLEFFAIIKSASSNDNEEHWIDYSLFLLIFWVEKEQISHF